MASNPPTPEEVEIAVANLTLNAEQARRSALERGVKVRRAEVEVFRRERDRLAARLGADHPRVRGLERAIAGAERLAEWASQTIERAKQSPEPKPRAWTLYGRVRGPKGEPAPNLIVRVTDRQGKEFAGLHDFATDANGQFNVSFDQDAIRDLLERQPDLFLTLFRTKGEPLYTFAEPFKARLGGLEVFDIRLPAAGEPAKDQGPAAPPKPTRPSQGPTATRPPQRPPITNE